LWIFIIIRCFNRINGINITVMASVMWHCSLTCLVLFNPFAVGFIYRILLVLCSLAKWCWKATNDCWQIQTTFHRSLKMPSKFMLEGPLFVSRKSLYIALKELIFKTDLTVKNHTVLCNSQLILYLVLNVVVVVAVLW
jgi:hypothetical protein